MDSETAIGRWKQIQTNTKISKLRFYFYTNRVVLLVGLVRTPQITTTTNMLKDRKTARLIDKQRPIDKEREIDKDKHKQRERETERERQTERDRDRERQRQRETER